MKVPAPPLPPRPTFLNDAAMVFLRLSGLAALLCLLYAVFGNERAGFVLLGGTALAALGAGTVIVLAGRAEAAALEAAPEGPPARRPVRFPALPAPTGTPLVGAAAVGLLAAGLVYGPVVTLFGAVIALLTVFAASAVVAGEHRGQPVNLLPVAIPVVAFFAIGSFMFLMSRILLAIPAHASTVVAMVLAASILFGAFFVANKPAIPTRTLLRGIAFLGVLFLGGGLTAAAVGQRPEERKGGPPPITEVAQNIAFQEKQLHFDAGSDVLIHFDNKDTVPHNIHFTVDQTGTQTVYRQDPLPGPISIDYKFKAPAAGHYFFHCDVHPNMQGTVTVTGTGGTTKVTPPPGPAGAPPAAARPPKPPSGPPPQSSADETALGIAFQDTHLTLKGNSPAVIHFHNQDSGIFHNVDITSDQGGTKVVFRKDPVAGPADVDYAFKTPKPGQYFFHCDVHPTMQGTLTVS